MDGSQYGDDLAGRALLMTFDDWLLAVGMLLFAEERFLSNLKFILK